jgi:hypothetical protein
LRQRAEDGRGNYQMGQHTTDETVFTVVVDSNVYVERVSTMTRVEVKRVGEAAEVPDLPEGPLVASQEDTARGIDMAGAGFAVVDVRALKFKEIAAIGEINLRGQLETTRGLYLEARATLDEAVGRARRLQQDDLGKHMPQARAMLE